MRPDVVGPVASPTRKRARRHEVYERWLLDAVVPFIASESGGRTDLVAAGVSLGAFHAANIALRHADRFPVAICMSGNYDPSLVACVGRAGRRPPTSTTRPTTCRTWAAITWTGCGLRCTSALVVGQGAFEEHPTHALSGDPSTLAELLGGKGVLARPGRVGPRRSARLGVLAPAGRAPPATLLLTHLTALTSVIVTIGGDAHDRLSPHKLGLLLGTENDWPSVFEHLVARLGSDH